MQPFALQGVAYEYNNVFSKVLKDKMEIYSSPDVDRVAKVRHCSHVGSLLAVGLLGCLGCVSIHNHLRLFIAVFAAVLRENLAWVVSRCYDW